MSNSKSSPKKKSSLKADYEYFQLFDPAEEPIVGLGFSSDDSDSDDETNLLRGGPDTSSSTYGCCFKAGCSCTKGTKGHFILNVSLMLLLAALLGGGIGFIIKNK